MVQRQAQVVCRAVGWRFGDDEVRWRGFGGEFGEDLGTRLEGLGRTDLYGNKVRCR